MMDGPIVEIPMDDGVSDDEDVSIGWYEESVEIELSGRRNA